VNLLDGCDRTRLDQGSVANGHDLPRTESSGRWKMRPDGLQVVHLDLGDQSGKAGAKFIEGDSLDLSTLSLDFCPATICSFDLGMARSDAKRKRCPVAAYQPGAEIRSFNAPLCTPAIHHAGSHLT